MAKTNEEILEAVRALDPHNDEHWTADGMPRLDAVENLLGDNVTRKAVTNAAPDFTRAVASELADALEDSEPAADDYDTEEAVPSSPEPVQEIDTASATGSELDEDDPLAEGPADFEAELDAGIAEAQQRVSDIQRRLEEGKRLLAEAEEELGKLVDEKNRQFPPMTEAEAIQQFQRNELAKRAAARGAGGTPSPLDAALAARRKARRQGALAE